MSTINARIDDATKAKAVKILQSLGMTTSQAITLFFKQIIYTRGIPFELRIPNELTTDTLDKVEAGEDLHEVSSIDKLFKELDN